MCCGNAPAVAAHANGTAAAPGFAPGNAASCEPAAAEGITQSITSRHGGGNKGVRDCQTRTWCGAVHARCERKNLQSSMQALALQCKSPPQRHAAAEQLISNGKEQRWQEDCLLGAHRLRACWRSAGWVPGNRCKDQQHIYQPAGCMHCCFHTCRAFVLLKAGCSCGNMKRPCAGHVGELGVVSEWRPSPAAPTAWGGRCYGV